MSIQDFNSQLTQDDQQDALMAALHRLAQADDRLIADQLTTDPMGIWDIGLTGE